MAVDLTKSSHKRGFAVRFEKLTARITKAAGSSTSFLVAGSVILVWALTGPIFGFSDTWQLVINTGTTIVTFLMVFVIQHAQNKDSLAVQLKLNELIAAEERASNRLVDIEGLTQSEMEIIKKFYVKLSLLAKKDNDLFSSHSIDEADDVHREKVTIIKTRAEKRKPKSA